MFSDVIECYQAIGAALASASRNSWDRIVLDATLTGDQVDVVAGCWQQGNAEATEYLTGVPRLARFIYELAGLISNEEKGLFKKFTFTLHKDGKFNVDFTY